MIRWASTARRLPQRLQKLLPRLPRTIPTTDLRMPKASQVPRNRRLRCQLKSQALRSPPAKWDLRRMERWAWI